MPEARKIDAAALSQIFLEARTYNGFLKEPVPEALLREAVAIALMGPTSANILPMRVVFVRSPEAKARLKPTLSAGNLDKTMAAPVTAITAFDMKFYEHLPFLLPHVDARPWFEHLPPAALTEVGLRNSSLQSAYLILALRAVGLDTGPMSGFDNAALDAEFFPDGRFKSNILINIGFGDRSTIFPRSPRFAFEQMASIV